MASTYKMVAYGSQGDAVRQLQSELNKHGYQLDEDGIFGSKTKAAVRDYQKKNSLRLDGIAGDETWGSLLSSPAAAAEETVSVPAARPSAKTAQALAGLEQGYTPSEDVTAAQAYRDSVAALRPDAYASAYEQQLAALYQELAGRQPFSYNPETDGAFARYARLYQQKGRAAMEDTVGQAAALTGGYGSSYAEHAGQQAYGQYMQELMALLPQFQEQAREAYDQEGQALRERYDLLDKQEKADYDRWQDGMSEWEKQLSLAQEQYDSASQQDRKLYETLLDHYRSMAQQEQKLAASGAAVDSGETAASGGESLSSTAADSLYRAMGNYLKKGRTQEAAALLAQYKSRMTPAQKRAFPGCSAATGRRRHCDRRGKTVAFAGGVW